MGDWRGDSAVALAIATCCAMSSGQRPCSISGLGIWIVLFAVSSLEGWPTVRLFVFKITCGNYVSSLIIRTFIWAPHQFIVIQAIAWWLGLGMTGEC